MSRIDLDIDGLEQTREGLADLREAIDEEPTYVVGTGVEYAVYLEFGTSEMPAYPFLRPAVREFEADPESFIDENTATTAEEIDTSEELVKTVAFALERKIKQNATAASSANRSPGTDPEHPQYQSGTLSSSIRAERVS